MKLTKEQKENRRQLAEISKRIDEERGKDRIHFHKDAPDFKYRSFVLFDGIKVTEGGFLCQRRWMAAKEMQKAETRWVRHSYATRADTYRKLNFSTEIDIEVLRAIDADYDLSAGCGQCGGCRWFAAMDADYGMCCNEKSPNDGRVTFEHGGCIQHSFIQEELAKGGQSR